MAFAGRDCLSSLTKLVTAQIRIAMQIINRPLRTRSRMLFALAEKGVQGAGLVALLEGVRPPVVVRLLGLGHGEQVRVLLLLARGDFHLGTHGERVSDH